MVRTQPWNEAIVAVLSLFFFVSGACGLIYQIVWLRLVMASFGVTAIITSIVLAIFMAGLSLGSWLGARCVRSHGVGGSRRFMLGYAAAELAIGVSGLVVAPLIAFGGTLLTGADFEWGSPLFYVGSTGWVFLVLLPPAACMGATLPLALASVPNANKHGYRFADLYRANVAGALVGVVGSAFVLIECVGFSGTMLIASALNFSVAIAAALYAFARRNDPASNALNDEPEKSRLRQQDVSGSQTERNTALSMLFCSGAATLGMEVVWARQFTPVLGTLVYSFATILAAYLAGTALGASRYRSWQDDDSRRARGGAIAIAAVLAGASALLPSLAVDPRVATPFDADNSTPLILANISLLATVGIFAAVTGFLTPLLIDVWSQGSPSLAGQAYAFNALGCIAGPLIASFLLLPAFGEHGSLNVLAAPYLMFGLIGLFGRRRPELGLTARTGLLATVVFAGVAAIFTRDFSSEFPQSQVRRDFTATTVATGFGMSRQLLVNGIGMTLLTTDTKMMVHLPLAARAQAPRDVLVICFGMGTSFRSAMAWNANVDVVELVPGVVSLFGFFHADAVAMMASTRAHVHVDY